mmetsp:Transcript_4439/g.10868  ORF Transcript_4439/g.10868 Transcript_4439/m.10868 type:complete len:938 (-) Transcript_4439:102-2915(-)
MRTQIGSVSRLWRTKTLTRSTCSPSGPSWTVSRLAISQWKVWPQSSSAGCRVLPPHFLDTSNPGALYSLWTVYCPSAMLRRSARAAYMLSRNRLAGPLGLRGDFTVGMGCEVLVCVADRDAATSNVIPGRFSWRVPIDATTLMPGGAGAAEVCAASLEASQTQTQNLGDLGEHLLRVYPSCVLSGGSQLDLGSQSVQDAGDTTVVAIATRPSKVRVTFPAAALPGCALRCRVNGRSLPISIVSACRSTAALLTSCDETEVATLVVNIAATRVDGVAMLELVRSSSHGPGGSRLEQPLHPHLYPLDDRNDLSSDAHFTHTSHDLCGVPVGFPAMPVLLVSDPEVHAALEEILALKGEERSDFGRHASTLYAVGGIVLRGTAPPRQAFQFTCLAASKGPTGRALTRRVLDLYPVASMIISERDAANFLLHATASGDLETVCEALYCCHEAAEARGFDASELARFPVGVAGETPLHRAAALHEHGGDTDVMYELLATLAKPLAWLMGSPQQPKLPELNLLVEAIEVAMATLVHIIRRYPQGAIEADASAAAEILREAISACSFPVRATPYESARSTITLEILTCTNSATRLLNTALHFNAAAAAVSSSSASNFSAPGHNDPHSLSLAANGTVYTFVAAACKRWPTLRRGCAVRAHASGIFDSVREGAMGGVRRLGRMTSWLGRHLPGGDGSLFFGNEPEVERMWMDARTRRHVALDHMAFMFIVLLQVTDLFKNFVPAMWWSADEQASRAMLSGLLYQLLRPCALAALIVVFKMCPLWYRRNREEIICLLRVLMMLSIIGSTQLFKQDDASPNRKILLYLTSNFVNLSFPIRADRHLFVSLMNIAVIVMFGQGHSYGTANDWHLRLVLVGANFVFTLLLEVQSRRTFSLERGKPTSSKQSRTEVAGQPGDWFKWGTSADYFNKPPKESGAMHTAAKSKRT